MLFRYARFQKGLHFLLTKHCDFLKKLKTVKNMGIIEKQKVSPMIT